MTETLAKDPRNTGIEISVHFEHFLDPSTLIFDLQNVSGERSAADVFRVLLQSAYALRDHQFQAVKLSFRGNNRFLLKGDYFKHLGTEYDHQNPVFTIRTFPEHLMLPSGSSAYGGWTGGILGVVTRQMQDFSDFHKKWYLADLLQSASSVNRALTESSSESQEETASPSASAEVPKESRNTSVVEAQTSPPVAPPSNPEPVARPPITTSAPSNAKQSWAEQVYVDSTSRYFYPENCPGRPSGAGRMPKSFAIHEGFVLAPACKP